MIGEEVGDRWSFGLHDDWSSVVGLDGWLSVGNAVIESLVDDFFLIFAVDDDVFQIVAVILRGLLLGLQARTGFGLFNGVVHYSMIFINKM